ncbi:ABC transporter ATP-binding protein/permease [Scytonema sp. PRP1]
MAQPYWFPLGKYNSLIALGLLVMLLLFLISVLFLLVYLGAWFEHQFFDKFFNEIAPGFFDTLNLLIKSPLIYLIDASLVLPVFLVIILRKTLIKRWHPWVLLGLLLFFSLAVSGLNVIISYVSRFFQTALANRDAPTFWRFLWVYFSVFVIGTPIVVYFNYMQDKLSLHWRRWMTTSFLERYFRNRAYYEINTNNKIDNPDQRIAEDINSFTNTSLSFLLLILNSIISVICFTGILWSISVPLVVVLLVYSTVGTLITIWFGKRLIGLNFNQIQQEANFRYSLVHIRNNAESIAFYQGEQQELTNVQQRFTAVLRNFNFLIGWQRNLGFFTTGYNYLNVILPSLIVVPLYFAHQIDFGAITQASFAFEQVLQALSVIVSQFNSLSAFIAGIDRLDSFKQAMTETSQIQFAGGRTLDVKVENRLSLEHITLYTPNYEKMLVSNLSVALQPNQGMLIMGKSGCGKSSLLRAIAGLWNSGTGCIVRPPLTEMLFLPQRPYILLGSLRSQLLYPLANRDLTDNQLYEVLQQVNLADLPERVGGFDAELDWGQILSLGEQQRLAFARLLLTAPRYAILDEATSALDAQNEDKLYELLLSTKTTFVSVGHRSSLTKYHHLLLELDGSGGWQVTPLGGVTQGIG